MYEAVLPAIRPNDAYVVAHAEKKASAKKVAAEVSSYFATYISPIRFGGARWSRSKKS